MNLNLLAKAICKIEGGKNNLSIAQVKEVLRCLGTIFKENDVETVLLTVSKMCKVSSSKKNRAVK